MHKSRGLLNSMALAWYNEPISNFISASRYLLGYRKPFNSAGLNPTLSEEDSFHNPTLLIHGNYHNQSAWISCAKALRKRNCGPLFTVNLTHGAYKQHDLDIIEAKLTFIKQLYAQCNRHDLKINLVGHSRGAVMAFYMGIKPEYCWIDPAGQFTFSAGLKIWREDIGYIIRLAHPTTEFEKSLLDSDKQLQLFDIVASRDEFVAEKSSLPHPNQLIYDCGHLGLLYSPAVHQQISNILQPG